MRVKLSYRIVYHGCFCLVHGCYMTVKLSYIILYHGCFCLVHGCSMRVKLSYRILYYGCFCLYHGCYMRVTLSYMILCHGCFCLFHDKNVEFILLRKMRFWKIFIRYDHSHNTWNNNKHHSCVASLNNRLQIYESHAAQSRKTSE